jgi:homocysteine S-methyltransferase
VLFETFLQNTELILAEGAIYERLRRHPSIEFDPHLAHATLIYDPASKETLTQVYREYLDIGQKHHLPMVVSTPTWRANREQLNHSEFKDYKVNQDNARFLSDIRASYGTTGQPIFIGGLMGPRGDAYRPEEALLEKEAISFHAYQIEALAQTNVDFLYATTLPAFSEASGLAAAMAKTNLPYILSFVIRGSGALLDGTPLYQAIEDIDATVSRPPTGYAVNCVHPTILLKGLVQEEIEGRSLTERIVGFSANTSTKSPEELDGLAELDTESPDRLAELMGVVSRQYHIPILGGCCGTGTEHIECLAIQLKASSQ